MIFRAIAALLILCLGCSAFAYDNIVDLIKRGEIEKARSLIAESSTAARRDGLLLFCGALLEPEGKESLKFLEASFKAELPPQYLEDNIYLEALYYLAEKNFERLVATADAYLQYWEAGRYRSEMIRLKALGMRLTGKIDKSEEQLERLIRENPGGLHGALGQLDRAVGLYEMGEHQSAEKICRKISDSNYDIAVVPALYLLSYYSIAQKEIDEAIFRFNVLKEGYPHAVGLDDLIDKFSGLDRQASDTRAEKITGTFYSVQVGVFSIKDNAERLAERIKKYGEKVELNTKRFSDKDYYVVYVGRFLSTDDAMAFKKRLELAEKEIFQVVAR